MSSADKLTIETPEQTAIEFPLAGIGSRFVAVAIDSLLRVAFLVVLGIIVALFGWGGMFSNIRWQWTIALLVIAYFLLETAYFAFFEVIWNGQTPGKRWTHLRVIKDSGRGVGVPDAILRNLMRIVDYLPSLYAVGVVTILISGVNKPDAAGTVVVHEKPLPVHCGVVRATRHKRRPSANLHRLLWRNCNWSRRSLSGAPAAIRN